MLGAVDRDLRVRPERAPVDQWVMVAGQDQGLGRLIEAVRPFRGLGPAEVGRAQVVDDVAAAQDQHALVAQGGQALAGFVVPAVGLAAIDAELDDRHVGVRIHRPQHAPGAMVQAARRVLDHDIGRQELADPRRQGRIAGRAVLDVEQRLREAAEIVDRLRRRPGADRRGAARLPVGADHQHRLRTRQLAA